MLAAMNDSVLRVFLSSTFLDMTAERDALARHTFPRLRDECENRGGTLVEVDLRWGITDEEAIAGRIVPICLEEIERAQVFIGILGHRYGAALADVAPATTLEPWTRDFLDRSLTEIEIRHAVLRRPREAKHALFYFLDSGPPRAGGEARVLHKDPRLEALKSEIRATGHQVRTYASPGDLADRVLHDLRGLLATLLPARRIGTSLELEAEAQTDHARVKSRVWVDRSVFTERLDSHVVSRGAPLVLVGNAGSGKTSLLAKWSATAPGAAVRVRSKSWLRRWMARWRGFGPQPLVVCYLASATPRSAEISTLLAFLVAELSRAAPGGGAPPEDPEALRGAFWHALQRVTEIREVVLIIDGCDRLDSPSQELDFLPDPLPEGLRLVLGTRPGRALQAAQRREWRTLEVASLTEGERRQHLSAYLDLYRRRLGEAHAQRIVSAGGTENPLFLRLLAEQVRLEARHEILDEVIDRYAQATDVRDLVKRILVRLERDYGGEDHLVECAFSMVAVARNGLTEAELADLCGSGGAPLPQARWAPLRIAAAGLLEEVGGYFRPANDDVSAVVQLRYLSSAEISCRRTLAEYFRSRPPSGRAIHERLWQLHALSDTAALVSALSEGITLVHAFRTDPDAVCRYWTELRSIANPVDVYRPLIDSPERSSEAAWTVGLLLRRLGRNEVALTVFQGLRRSFATTGDAAGESAAAGIEATLLSRAGKLDEAIALHEEAERRVREKGTPDEIQKAIGNLAVALLDRKRPEDLQRSAALHAEEERLCDEAGDIHGRATARFNRGRVFAAYGDAARALRAFEEHRAYCKRTFHLPGLTAALLNLAILRRGRGDDVQVASLLAEAERLARLVGDDSALCASLRERAVLLQIARDFDGSKGVLDEHDAIARRNGDAVLEVMGLFSRASLHANLNDTRKACELTARAHAKAKAAGITIPGHRRNEE